MRRPVVDYSQFRLSRLNDPRFSHMKLIGIWFVYFALYYLTETFIPAEKCTPVACFLDDLIPFQEIFFIPYVVWYGLVIGSLLYFLLYDIKSFKDLSWFLFLTQIVAMAICILFPNRQDLRPAVFPRDNFLTDCVAYLYTVDTNTGVCPSLHVAFSLGIGSVWQKKTDTAWYWKLFVWLWVVLICLSTVFIKQHSAVDVFAALPLCLLAELWVFRMRYFGKN